MNPLRWASFLQEICLNNLFSNCIDKSNVKIFHLINRILDNLEDDLVIVAPNKRELAYISSVYASLSFFYKNYQKKTGQESAILIATGKMNGLNIVAAEYNSAFGSSAISLREAEHLLTGMQYALDKKVDAFISFYSSGGMDVKGNLFSLGKGMSTIILAMSELKKKNIW